MNAGPHSPTPIRSGHPWVVVRSNNEFQVNGISNTYAEGNGRARVAFNPPPSAIGQFKIITNPFDAAAGNSMGATVNVSTKAGTNQLHGEGHYYSRNSAFDTMDFFLNKRGSPKTVFQDHRFGASVGGPITIPKIYNGRNRTFFFYAWDMSVWGAPQSFTSTVPTAAQREGDFSGLLARGANYQIYDPYSTRPAANNRYQRDVFPNNIIPELRALTKPAITWPTSIRCPTSRATSTAPATTSAPAPSDENYWVHLARFDHAFSDKHRVFLRVNYDFWEEHKNPLLRFRHPGTGASTASTVASPSMTFIC